MPPEDKDAAAAAPADAANTEAEAAPAAAAPAEEAPAADAAPAPVIIIKKIIDDDGEILKAAQQIIIGNMHGHPVPLIIEAARVCISHHVQPSFAELFDALRK